MLMCAVKVRRATWQENQLRYQWSGPPGAAAWQVVTATRVQPRLPALPAAAAVQRALEYAPQHGCPPRDVMR